MTATAISFGWRLFSPQRGDRIDDPFGALSVIVRLQQASEHRPHPKMSKRSDVTIWLMTRRARSPPSGANSVVYAVMFRRA